MNNTDWYQRVLAYRKPNGGALSGATCKVAEVLQHYPDGYNGGNVALAKAIGSGSEDKNDRWKAQWISRLLRPMREGHLITVDDSAVCPGTFATIYPNMTEEERSA